MFKGVIVNVQSDRENDPIHRSMLKATVRAAIDAFNEDDEAYVVVNHGHPQVVMELPLANLEQLATSINLAPRCSAWVEYDDHGIRLKTRLYGIDQIVVIPYGSIYQIHARNDRSRKVALLTTVIVSEPVPPTTPNKPKLTVVK